MTDTRNAPPRLPQRIEGLAGIATNLAAPFTLAPASIRPMVKQKGGRIIAISSVVVAGAASA